MKICFFVSSFLPRLGGMEVVVDKLARNFQIRGLDVTVLSKISRDSHIATDLPYKVIYYPRSKSQRLFLGPGKRALLNAHGKYSFDIIHAHALYPVGYIAAKLQPQLNRPLVLTSHGGDILPGTRYSKRWLVLRRIGWAVGRANSVTAVSSDTKKAIDRLAPAHHQSLVIPNGVDLDITPPDEIPGRFTHLVNQKFLLSLCRFHHPKGLDVLLKAFALLKDSTALLPSLVLAGDGKEGRYLQGLSLKLGIGKKVYFPGTVFGPEKAYLFSRCLFFIQPSRREGMPLTVLEAMAAGKAVVASDIAGVRELLAPGSCGLLVPPDSPRQLSAALAELLNQPYTLAQMSARALSCAQEYSWPRIADQYLKLYEELMPSAGS